MGGYPKWFYAISGISFVAAIVFGVCFFNMLEENSHLKDVEWLYRRERASYKPGKAQDAMIIREKDFLMSTPHESDSIRNFIRGYEEYNHIDKPLLYFCPTEK